MILPTRWLVVLLMLTLGASWARGTEESDVKAAAKAFANALAKGDADLTRQNAISDEVTVSIIVNLAPVVTASHRLHDAAVAKFGKDGEELAPNPGANMSDWSKRADQSVAKIAGETATLTPKPDQPTKAGTPAEQPLPLKFKKEGGQWKVDLSGMSTAAQMKQTAPRYKAIAQGMNLTADEINAGKYKDAKLATAALTHNVNAAMLDQNATPSGSRSGAGGRGQN
jgi:hypothetical protein